ncbi:MAG: hypothetical protein P1U58_07650 [Verrucomicrobiales bacterium]|nr:hypothetical protein [Verrucomicrobiales bacterium]
MTPTSSVMHRVPVRQGGVCLSSFNLVSFEGIPTLQWLYQPEGRD